MILYIIRIILLLLLCPSRGDCITRRHTLYIACENNSRAETSAEPGSFFPSPTAGDTIIIIIILLIPPSPRRRIYYIASSSRSSPQQQQQPQFPFAGYRATTAHILLLLLLHLYIIYIYIYERSETVTRLPVVNFTGTQKY